MTQTEVNGVTLSTPLTTTYTYDPAGNKTGESLSNGTVTTYTYDDLNRLTNITSMHGSTVIFNEAITLNADGLRTAVADSGHGLTSLNAAYGYDAMNRLSSQTFTSGFHDSDAFTFDLAGNRMNDWNTTSSATYMTTYAYNGDDQLLTSGTQRYISGSPFGIAAVTTYTYDPNGSMLTASSGSTVSTYTYDTRNKLSDFASSSTSAVYYYDDEGNLAYEVVNGVTSTTILDTNNPTGFTQPYEVKSSSGGAESYIIGDRVVGQVDQYGNSEPMVVDAHGSTRVLMTSTGGNASVYYYDAFGASLGGSLSGTAFLFGGDAIYDPASGLYFHGDGTRDSRGFYFTQMDSMGYVDNANPITLNLRLLDDGDTENGGDPSGHDFDLVTEISGDGWGAAEDAQMNADVAAAGAIGGTQLQSVMVGLESQQVALGELIDALGSGSDQVITSVTSETTNVLAVIGSYAATATTSSYLALASALGGVANFLNVPQYVWCSMTAEEQWDLNEEFLWNAIQAGQTFISSTPDDLIKAGTALAREVAYLEMAGYTWDASGTTLSPGG